MVKAGKKIENVFPINRELKQKIPCMDASLIRVLLEHYQIYYSICLVVLSKNINL